MSLAYALPYFCDVMLYFGALGGLGLLRHCTRDLLWVPALLLAAACLCHGLTGRGKPWLRYLPSAVAVPCLLLAGNGPGRLASLPMLAYLPIYVFNNRRAPDYDYAADRFRHSLILTGVLLFFCAVLQAKSYRRGLPFLFLYFTLNMALLRLLRHDDAVARSRRFRFLNLSGVALVCAAGFALSQPAIVSMLAAGWRWFSKNVLLNLLALALYAVQLVLYGLSRLLAWLPGLLPQGAISMPQPMPEDAAPDLAGAARQVQVLPAFVRLLIQAAGVLLLALVVFLILRALSRRIARVELPSGTDERESLDALEPPRPRRGLRRDPQEGVRRQYRRALSLIRARGGRVAPTMNTLQIQDENADRADPEAMAALRALYLPARYANRPATREDISRARAAVERLRRTGK